MGRIIAEVSVMKITVPKRARHMNDGRKKSSYETRTIGGAPYIIKVFPCFCKMNHKGYNPVLGSHACFTMIRRVFITLSILKNRKIFIGSFTCLKRMSRDEVSLGCSLAFTGNRSKARGIWIRRIRRLEKMNGPTGGSQSLLSCHPCKGRGPSSLGLFYEYLRFCLSLMLFRIKRLWLIDKIWRISYI